MNKKQAKNKASPAKHQHIQQVIHRCAAELHFKGELRTLATAMGLTPRVFSYWFKKGRVPRPKAEWLENRFGKEIADASTLTA